MQQLAPVDLVVIGGGINGAGIARDAAGRGLSVALCENSWRSGKRLHGGSRDPQEEPVKDSDTKAFEYSGC